MSKETGISGIGAGRGSVSGGGKTTGQVQSLIRGLTILERLAAARDGDTLSDLAQGVGLAPSTTHRLLKSLEQMRFVSHDVQLGRWFIGVQAFTVGNSFLYHRDFVELARPVMRRLMEESGETANLFVLDDGYAVTLSQVQCTEMMRMLARLGGRAPVHASAGGKALLAALPDDEVSAILHRRGLPQLTPSTIVTPASLREELADIRRCGYAIDDEEHAVGLRCVASAVFDEHGEPLAAISLSGPMARISREDAVAMGNLVMQATAEVTAALGGVLPDSRTRPGSADG